MLGHDRRLYANIRPYNHDGSQHCYLINVAFDDIILGYCLAGSRAVALRHYAISSYVTQLEGR